jgi:hypothetical protein
MTTMTPEQVNGYAQEVYSLRGDEAALEAYGKANEISDVEDQEAVSAILAELVNLESENCNTGSDTAEPTEAVTTEA